MQVLLLLASVALGAAGSRAEPGWAAHQPAASQQSHSDTAAATGTGRRSVLGNARLQLRAIKSDDEVDLPLPDGVIRVTDRPFSADPSGASDATAALQAAFDEGARSRRTVLVNTIKINIWFSFEKSPVYQHEPRTTTGKNFRNDDGLLSAGQIPAGRYRVTDTLNCSISWSFMTTAGTDPGPPTPDFLFAAHVIVGARYPAGTQRSAATSLQRRPATLFVPPNTPGFTSRAMSKFVVHFWHTGSRPDQSSQPDININQVLQGVDVEIGHGNVGAVGIMHLGAQGSSLEDVTVWAGDAAVGIAGGAGGGGSHTNVKVVGGRIGLDLRASQPAPTVTGAILINQSCSAIIYAGRGPLSLIGARIQQLHPVSTASPGTIAAGLNTETAFQGDCALPTAPERVSDSSFFGGSISVVDSVLERSDTGLTPAPAVVSEHGVFLRNVYTKGIDSIVVLGNGSTNPVLRSLGVDDWTHVQEFAVAQRPRPFHYSSRGNNDTFQFTAPVVNDGKRYTEGEPYLAQPLERALPEPMLCEQHIWDEATFPSFQSRTAANALTDCGAVGDGRTDDHAALQRCVDEHSIVVLPKGFYKLTRTLVLSRPGGSLVGVGRTASVLTVAASGFVGESLLKIVGPNTTLFQLEYISFWRVADVYLLDWQSPSGVWRQAHGYRTCDLFVTDPPPTVGPSCAGYPSAERDKAVALDRPLSVISGGGRFYSFYVEDWHFQGPGYRHLLVNNSHHGVALYHINPDCGRGDATVEVRNSSVVSIFGMKSEGNFCQLWLRQSSQVLYTGFGGFASPFGIDQGYPKPYAQYTPSMIRIENSSYVTLANLVGACRIGCQKPNETCDDAFGGVGVSPAKWSFVMWQSGVGAGTASEERLTPALERPVVFKLT